MSAKEWKRLMSRRSSGTFWYNSSMTEKEALKILAQQEKRFKDAGFGRGVVLAKSAHDYHKALLEWRRKEAQSRKLLDDIARIRKVCVPLKKTVRNGDILKTRERQAQRRFAEKVDLLRRMEVA